MRIFLYISVAFFLTNCSERISDDSNLDQLTYDPKVTYIKASLDGDNLEFDEIKNGLCSNETTSKIELTNKNSGNHLRIHWKKGKDKNHFVFNKLPTLKLIVDSDGELMEFFLSSKTQLSDFNMFHTDRKVHHLKGEFKLMPANDITQEKFEETPILVLDVQKAQIK